MNKLSSGLLLSVAAIFFLTEGAAAQPQTAPSAAGSSQERMLRELVEEVRLLRVTLQRTTSFAYRAQITADRLKIQMDQVARLSNELNEVRERLNGERMRQPALKVALEEMTKQKEAGTLGEGQVRAIFSEIEGSQKREQSLNERESALSSELASARIELTELKSRLDRLESEISAPVNKEVPQKQEQPPTWPLTDLVDLIDTKA